MAKSKSYKKKLPKYADGGEGPPSTLDIIKKRKIQQAMSEEAARRKGAVALPDITKVNTPDEQVVETKAKPKATVKGTRIPIKQQAQLKPSYKTEEQRLADEARGNYIENPTVMDYLGQAGYMPLLAMSDPFSMGQELKKLRQSQSDPRLSARQKFSQGMDIANEATGNALLNVATEGIGEAALPLANKLGQGVKRMYELNPRAWTKTAAERLDDPELYKSAFFETSKPSWSDPVGRIKFNKLNKELNRLNVDEYNKVSEQIAKASSQGDKTLLSKLSAERNALSDKAYELEKQIENLGIQRSGLPLKAITTEGGTSLGGGQGRLYVNTLNPEEVVKIGQFTDSPADMQKLIETGKQLNMPNVAFPTKAIPVVKQKIGNVYGAQFMPWLGSEPLNPNNPFAKRLSGLLNPHREELIDLAKKLDQSNVGIDYYGAGNIAYNPRLNKPVIFDVNYINKDNPINFNLLDKPVEQRLATKYIREQKYGGWLDEEYGQGEGGFKNLFIKSLTNKEHGGPIYNNMAGKLNRRKGLPSRFPMYKPGGYTSPDDRRVNRLSQSLLSDWDYNTQYDPYKSKTQPALGSNSTINDTGKSTGATNRSSGTNTTNTNNTGDNTNWLGLASAGIGALSSLTQKPQGSMSDVYGSTGYLDSVKKANEQGTALKSGVSSVFSAIPGWGQIASVGIQANDLLTNLVAPVDEYGMAETETQQWVRNILDPTAAVMGAFQGVNIFDYDKMKSERNKLINNYNTKKTAEAQDAYAQAVKSQEGKYLEKGGYMPMFLDGGMIKYANGGRMVNPYNGEPNAEIEGEVVNHANGGIQDFSHLPDHEQATTANEVSLAPKTFIFSKRIKNPVTGRPFATDAKRYTTTSEEKIFDNKQATPITSKTAKLMFGVKKQLADNLAELHEATKVYNGAQKAENEATEEFIGMLGGMYGKGGLIKRKDGSYSPRGLWDNIRANKGSGKKPTKAMLEQERKIKAQEKAMGGYMYKDGGSFNNPGFKALPGYVQAKIKGNYEYGGYTLGESYDMSEDEIKELKRQGYTFDIE